MNFKRENKCAFVNMGRNTNHSNLRRMNFLTSARIPFTKIYGDKEKTKEFIFASKYAVASTRSIFNLQISLVV